MAAPTRSRRISSTPLRPRKRKDKTPAAPPKPAAVGPIPKPDAPPAPVIEFRGVAKEYDSGDVGLEQRDVHVAAASSCSSSARPARASRPLMRLLIKELEPTGGHDPRGRPRPRRDHRASASRSTAATSAWSSRTSSCCPTAPCYDNVAYALQVTGAAAQGDPRQGAGHPAPDRAADQAPQLPRPALGRRAAARLDRARVRQPPAAAAGRRADRQPRPRDLDRDHAAALPDQPHRHDRPGRHARPRDGRPHAPARDRARRAGAIVRDEAAGLYARATRPRASSPRACAARARRDAESHAARERHASDDAGRAS